MIEKSGSKNSYHGTDRKNPKQRTYRERFGFSERSGQPYSWPISYSWPIAYGLENDSFKRMKLLGEKMETTTKTTDHELQHELQTTPEDYFNNLFGWME